MPISWLKDKKKMMTSNKFCCGPHRIKGPSGTWELGDLIGAKVRIKSMPVHNYFGPSRRATIGTCTIAGIRFQVSLDGKAVTVIDLAEVPGDVYAWKDLEIISLAGGKKPGDIKREPIVCKDLIVGEFNVGSGGNTKTTKFGCA